MIKNIAGLAFVLGLLFTANVSASEYSFDLSEIEKKPYSFGGYVELLSTMYQYDDESAVYGIKYQDEQPSSTAYTGEAKLRLNGTCEVGDFTLSAVTDTSFLRDELNDSSQHTKFLEGYASWSKSPSFTIFAGKKNIKWGKGYAFSPAALIDRQKNPDDPEAVLEGHELIAADYIRQIGGAVKNITLTPVIFYVNDDINRSMSGADGLGYAGKLYALIYDTDVDIMFSTLSNGGSKYGFDFSRNLTSAIELHGEYAKFQNYEFYSPSGSRKETSDNYLVGFRYLTDREITIIGEYYHKSEGYTEEQMERMYKTGSKAVLKNFAMKDYLYLRTAFKEPFNILYLTPAFTITANADDNSFSASPEIVYTGFTNYELKAKATSLFGDEYTEYGEKPAKFRLELSAKLYF